jgi:flagellar protein FliO/FliZ
MKSTQLSIAASAAFLGLLVLPARVLAAATRDSEKQPLNLDEEVDKTTTAAGGSSGGGSLVRTFVGLAVVIGVIYGIYWILKQVKASREERSSGFGLASLATLPLGPNRSLHMVRAGSDVVVLGVTDNGVTPIRTYAEDEACRVGLIEERESETVRPMTLEEAEEAAQNGANGSEAAAPAPDRPATVGDFMNRLFDEMRRRTRR